MIQNKTTYRSLRLIMLHKNWIVLCFLLLFAVNARVIITRLLAETKYELNQNATKKSIDEKESMEISDDDNEEFLHANLPISPGYSKRTLSYFEFQKYFLKLQPAIHLPPPKFGYNYILIFNNNTILLQPLSMIKFFNIINSDRKK